MRITAPYKNNLELTVCLSLITAQPLELNDIAVTEGGLTSSQISFLQLLEKLTNGASFIINETGCRLRVIPGSLVGGEVEHDCDHESAIGYYAMYLILLGPFCQKPIEANLRGVTNRRDSLSPECLSYGVSDVLKPIIGDASMFELVVKQRGAYPSGGGLVQFRCRPVQSLRPLERVVVGKLQKVRGVAWSARVNPTLGKRQIDGAKEQLTKYLSDVYLLHDHKKGADSGASPGYGVVLVATSTEGVAYAAETTCERDGAAVAPEDVGRDAATLLGRHIARGGVVAPDMEPLLLAMVALGRRNASKLVLGVPSAATIQAVRDIHAFTGVRFAIDPVRPGSDAYRDNCGDQLLFSCVGAGLVNLNRAIR